MANKGFQNKVHEQEGSGKKLSAKTISMPSAQYAIFIFHIKNEEILKTREKVYSWTIYQSRVIVST